jgi:hypothetical protein
MGMSGFIRAGDKYVKMGQSGMPHIIRNYRFYEYKPIPIPQVRDSNGKQWNLLDLETLLGEEGPSATDLGVMADLAMSSMESKFKEVYNPEKPVTHETPSEYSAYRQAMAGSSFLSGQSQGMELDISKYYLVGEVVGGTFGRHHHDEFFSIISEKEKLAFLDQVVVNEQQRKAKKRAEREGMWETVGTVIAVVGVSILTGGAAAGFLAPLMTGAVGTGITIAAGAAIGGYIAYQGHKGYQMGGEKGLLLGVATAAIGMYTAGKGMAFTAGGSYSYEQGFGVSMGYSFMGGAEGKTQLGSIGMSYSEKGGFGLNAGYNFNPNMSINANIHQSGAWGVGGSLHGTQEMDKRQVKHGLALNVGYRETADGKVGLTGGVNYNHSMLNEGSAGTSTFSFGYNYDTIFGGGVSLGYSQTDTGRSVISGMNSQVSWNVNSGFQSQLDISYSWERTAQTALDTWDYMKSVAQGVHDSMANAWDDAITGLGYFFRGQDEDSLLNDLFGHSDEYKMKKYWESLSPEERIRILTSNFAPANGTGGVAGVVNQSGSTIVQEKIDPVQKLKDKIAGIDSEAGVDTEDIEEIKKRITNVYVLGTYPQTKKLINELTKDNPELREELLSHLNSDQKKWTNMDIWEQKSWIGREMEKNALEDLGLEVYMTLSPKTSGNPNDIFPFRIGTFKVKYPVITDEIKFLIGDVAPNISQAERLPNITNTKHYEETDEGFKVDLKIPHNDNNNMAWWGPNSDFRVDSISITGGNAAFQEADDVHGTNIKISILDSNGDVKERLELVHMTSIHIDILRASQTGETLKAGTFLGITARQIGGTSGPHLHIASLNRNHRSEIWKYWTGRK